MIIAWVVPSEDRHSGCAWYRCIEPGRIAGEMGHESWLVDMLWMGDTGPVRVQVGEEDFRRPDLIVMRPTPDVTIDVLMRAKEHGQRTVLTMDDDPWLWETTEVIDWSVYEMLFAAVDEVWCSTAVLLHSFRNRNPHTTYRLVPNAYDPFRYERVPWREPAQVGWHVMADLRAAEDLALFARLELPPIVHLGDGELPGAVAEHRERVTIEDLPAALDWQIGLVVLASTPFNGCKTETKAFELGARGIPIVAVTRHPLYQGVPGQCTIAEVPGRIKRLSTERAWRIETDRVRTWAVKIASRYRAAVWSTIETAAPTPPPPPTPTPPPPPPPTPQLVAAQ